MLAPLRLLHSRVLVNRLADLSPQFAKIEYKDGSEGRLLLVKPRLTFSEPPELLAYRAKPGCGDFPQQTTSDQFFDEEQCEAYRQLGELTGNRLFPKRPPNFNGWLPFGGVAEQPKKRISRNKP
jgi:hypothetical protein